MKYLYLTISIIALVIIVGSHYAKADISTGLVGYWAMDTRDIVGTSVYDRSGSGNNGTMVNGPTKVIGKMGQALNFNGTSQYVTLPSGIDSLITGNSITVSTWVYLTSTSTCDTSLVTQRFTSGSALMFTLISGTSDVGGDCSGNSGQVTAAYYNGTWRGVKSVGLLSLNQWYLVTGTYDGSTFKIYINGALDNSASYSGSLPNNGLGWNIAKRWDVGNYITGNQDDVRIYNRALSAGEVRQLYLFGLQSHVK